MNSLRVLSQAIDAARKMKTLLLIVTLLYVVSYLVGWYLISIRSPVAVETARGISENVLAERPFTTIVQSLRGGELANAILFTFLLNLTVGAFLSTTLPGVIPLVGALAPILVTLFRGFAVGVTYPKVLASSATGFVLGFGTMVLELGAYVFSGAAGIHIAMAPILPKRYGASSRWGAFKVAWKDVAKVYVIVVLLLALGAIWEMTLLFLALRTTA